jgi:hypothetical protein
MANLTFITPFLDKLDHCLSIGGAPSQGLVYALDTDVVIKLPFQYIIPDDPDNEAIFYLEHGLKSFLAMERELAVYDAAANRPHNNIARRFKVNSSSCLFLERLQPLEDVWANSDMKMRYRWVRELVDVVSWLEELGFTHGDLAVRNLAVDTTYRLKLFDFGSATSKDHYDYLADKRRDYSGLSTCIHYLLTGVDPFANLHSAQDVLQIERRLVAGHIAIGAGAENLTNVIQAGWTGKIRSTSFLEVKRGVEAIIGEADLELLSVSAIEENHQGLQDRCVEWLRRATPDPRWMTPNVYCAACRAKGYDIEIDKWR